MALAFQKASKRSAKLRMSLIGVAGSGKTYTALNIATHLGGPVAVIDTEHGSASKYSDVFDFDVLELESFSPQTYMEAIRAADEAGYNVLIIDSLSHAWTGKDGALELVDRAAKRQQTSNTFGAWRDVTPLHNAMVDTIIASRLHIIATMRAKTEYVQEKDSKTGRTTVRKVGLAPVQRDGLEYEFDVVADLDQDNNLIVGKTRCPSIAGAVMPKAGKEIASKLTAWLTDGTTTVAAAPKLRPAGARAGERAGERNEVERSVERVAERVEPAVAGATPFAATPFDDAVRFGADDAPEAAPVLCHCGLEAKYIRGKSGAGWVCGHHGTKAPLCDFRQRDASPLAADDGAVINPFDEQGDEDAPLTGGLPPAMREAVTSANGGSHK